MHDSIRDLKTTLCATSFTPAILPAEPASIREARSATFRSSAQYPKLPAGLASSYLHVHTIGMGTIRKTISLPEQIAKRLDKEAKRRKMSVSAIVTELVQQQQPARLPYAGLIDDDEQMSQNIEQILARLGS